MWSKKTFPYATLYKYEVAREIEALKGNKYAKN